MKFTRRTYRVARRRAFRELQREDVWVQVVAHSSGQREDVVESDFWPLYKKVCMIVDRARREGVWK